MEAAFKFANRTIFIAGALALFAASVGLSGCAHSPKNIPPGGIGPVTQDGTPPPGPVEANSSGETFGPPPPPSTYGPEPIQLRPIVLVLGPGLARGFAYVGAIRALAEAKIPIAAVLGTEMGAFVASIYSMDAKINQFEWALLRFKDYPFVSPKGLLPAVFRKANHAKKFESELSRVFEKKDLNQSKLPLRVAVQIRDSGVTIVLERGQVADAIRAAMADPETFEPSPLNGQAAQSASKSRPFLISEARAMSLGSVLVIDALDEAEEKSSVSASEFRDADLVIRPNLTGIGPLDFHKRTDAAFRGKKAVNDQMAEIRHLVGLPVEAEPQKGSP